MDIMSTKCDKFSELSKNLYKGMIPWKTTDKAGGDKSLDHYVITTSYIKEYVKVFTFHEESPCFSFLEIYLISSMSL